MLPNSFKCPVCGVESSSPNPGCRCESATMLCRITATDKEIGDYQDRFIADMFGMPCPFDEVR